MDRSEDQPVELIEATESDRSTGISDVDYLYENGFMRMDYVC